MRAAAFLLLLLAAVAAVCAHAHEEFVRVTALPDQRMLAHAVFAVPRSEHAAELPLGVRALLSECDIDAFHVSFSHGRWNAHAWGAAPSPAASGAEVFVQHRVAARDVDLVENASAGVRVSHAHRLLSGLVGGSFGGVPTSRTWSVGVSHWPSPPEPFARSASMSASASASAPLVTYLGEPREAVCTENIAPLMQLLPCRHSAGLAAALRPVALCRAEYLSIGVHLEGDRMVVWFTAVLPREPGAAAAPGSVLLRGESVFDRVERPCVAAQGPHAGMAELVGVSLAQVQPERLRANVSALPDGAALRVPVALLAELLLTHGQLAVGAGSEAASADTRFALSQRLRDGVLHWSLSCPAAGAPRAPGAAAHVTCFSPVPWYVRLFTRGVHVLASGKPEVVTRHGAPASPRALARAGVHVFPGEDRVRPGYFTVERNVSLDACTNVDVELPYSLSYLRVEEHQPDPHRGYGIAAAFCTVTVRSGSGGEEAAYRLVSEAGVAYLPLPDFSMPFNATALTATVFVIVFGGVLNAVTRKASRTAALPASAAATPDAAAPTRSAEKET